MAVPNNSCNHPTHSTTISHLVLVLMLVYFYHIKHPYTLLGNKNRGSCSSISLCLNGGF